jgi:propionate CoA-transferase
MHPIALATTIGRLLRRRAAREAPPGAVPLPLLRPVLQLIHYRLTWDRRDLDFVPPVDGGTKFLSARQAAALIPDRAVVLSTGIAANGRCSIFFWAVRDRFERSGHPAGLTWITVAGVGGRGRAPGTVEELGLPGLVARHIGGHLETHKSLLRLADEGKVELHTLPQGVMAFLLEGQAEGRSSLTSEVGVGTFLDPRVGTGSRVTPGGVETEPLVRARGDRLEFRLPAVEVACICAPYADREGNVYFRDAAVTTENRDAARAARANGGRVLVTVSGLVEKSPAEIALPADLVDALVVNPRNEQTGGVLQQKYFPMFTPGAPVDVEEAYLHTKLPNLFTGITPVRGPVEQAIARLAASLFIREVGPGAVINVGVGISEEVGRLFFESGLYRDLTFTTESGVYGGLPVSGMYFGAAIAPERIISSAEMFHLYERRLDVTLLGFLQVDSRGNVNVSKRGPRASDYVGPGGLPDLTHFAKTILFSGSWMDGADFVIRGGSLRLRRAGLPKFVEAVDEISFSGEQALRAGKRVFYATTVGLFQLTEEGVKLLEIMPGIGVERIRESCSARLLLGDVAAVPTVSPEIVTGEGFRLRWPGRGA